MARAEKQAAKRVTGKPATSIEGGEDVVMSIRLEGAMHERLRKLAFDRRGKMRDFIVRGIEQVLREEKY